MGRFLGARARFSDTEVADEDEASDSVDDGDADDDECAAPAFTMSRSSRSPVGMQDDVIAPPSTTKMPLDNSTNSFTAPALLRSIQPPLIQEKLL